MDEDQSIYVCGRVTDIENPRPESTIGECDECHSKIYKMPHAPTHMPVLCWQCASEMLSTLKEDDEVEMLPGAMAKLELN